MTDRRAADREPGGPHRFFAPSHIRNRGQRTGAARGHVLLDRALHAGAGIRAQAVLRRLAVDPPFSPAKRNAVAQLPATSVTRVYLQLANDVWDAEDGAARWTI